MTSWQTENYMFYFYFSEWSDEQVPPTNILRLIYQGRFLHGNVTLAGRLIVIYQGRFLHGNVTLAGRLIVIY
jgi:hypothetical protein